MKRIVVAALIAAGCGQTWAQRIDFNLPGKESTSMEDGYMGWSIGRQTSSEGTFTTADGRELTITASAASGTYGNAVMCNWWKDGVSKYSKLLSDALVAIYLDEANNYTYPKDKPMGIRLTINGLTAGKHTLTAYHNITDNVSTAVPSVKVLVDGNTVLTGIEQTIRCQKVSDSGSSYVVLTATEGQPVTIEYITEVAEGQEFNQVLLAINGLALDESKPSEVAADPQPAHLDMHADCDEGAAHLSWRSSATAVSHRVLMGTQPENLKEIATTAQPSLSVDLRAAGMTSDIIRGGKDGAIYWRVDEVDASGESHEGDVWLFRPRHLAFPGAEGYGRFATGGRGGSVYHVTSLDDDVDNPQPGTFRYGIRNVKGPRTIVFDVSGYITLKGRLTCSDEYVTIAGQTAPGKGIIFRGAPVGVASEGITRFLRNHRGFAATEADQDKGLDGFGMAGNDHSIMDHCSVAWTTDEAFSSRNAKNITLQRTLISEALNIANHPNYSSGTKHGYAATIGGDTGTYHHNLLAHCEGRNWSLSGGLDGGGAYAGRHDIFNNVVYNWGGRATDGGTHECNFVGNYYKKGPATSQNYLLNAQLEGTGTGTQSYYVSGNIRQEKDNGTKTQDKQGTTYRYSTSGGQKVDWNVFVTKPFFPSYAVVETAEAAYRNTLSDVGCNQPMMDNHDVRMVKETYTATTSTVGSKSGKKGLIDRETDAGGYEEFEVVRRDATFDTDQDGMPDWWEKASGYDVNQPDNNLDADGDGYTALEDYLNWMAEPHYEGKVSVEIDLAPLFAGYGKLAAYSTDFTRMGFSTEITGSMLTVTSTVGEALVTVPVTCKEGDYTFVRNVNIHFLPVERLAGDANSDGSVTVTDITVTANYILGNGVPESFSHENADSNADGDITVSDIVTDAGIILTDH